MVELSARDSGTRDDAPGDQTGQRVPSDASGHSRQVLVVGDGLFAGVTAGFLAQAGLDPVLAAPAHGRQSRATTVLWEPGLALLERIGLRRPVERLGRPLQRLDCLTTCDSWTGEDSPALLAIGRDELAELLDQQVLTGIRTNRAAVTAIEATDAGVRVSFEGGIDEQFDAALTTTRSLVPDRRHRPPTRTAHTWTFEWPATVTAPSGPTEAWAENRAAFTVPLRKTARVQLVSTVDVPPARAISTEDVGRLFASLFENHGNPFEALDGTSLQYSQQSCAVPRSVQAGNVALVGPATRTTLPGDCLGPTRSIEEAWLLADALAYGPEDVAEALAAYTRRRRQRDADLLAAISNQSARARASTALAPLLQRLHASRTLAFSRVLNNQLPDCVLPVPQRL